MMKGSNNMAQSSDQSIAINIDFVTIGKIGRMIDQIILKSESENRNKQLHESIARLRAVQVPDKLIVQILDAILNHKTQDKDIS